MKLLSQLKTVLLNAGIPLFVFTLLITSADQGLTQLIEKELMSSDGASSTLWVWIALSLSLAILVAPLNVLIVLSGKLKDGRLSFFKSHINQLLIEETRALGSTLLWGILLIIPGLIKLIQYVFVPFIVTQDSDYKSGSIDALKKSKIMVNKHIFKISFLLLVFNAIIPLLLSAFSEYKLIITHPISSILFIFIEMILSTLLVLLLQNIWEKTHGTIIQLEANS